MESAVLDPHLPHASPGQRFTVNLHGDREMLTQRFALLVDCWRGEWRGARREQRFRVLKDPWVADRAARDPDDVDTGLAQHAHGILRREHVAAAEDRLVRMSPLHVADDRPVGPALILLLDRSPVDTDRAVTVREGRFDDLVESIGGCG